MKKIITLVLTLALALTSLIGCSNASAIDTSYIETNTINGVVFEDLNGYRFDDTNDVYILDFTHTWTVKGDINIQKINECSQNSFEIENINTEDISLTKKISIHWAMCFKTLDISPEQTKLDLTISSSLYDYNFLVEEDDVNSNNDCYRWIVDNINKEYLKPNVSIQNSDNFNSTSALTRVDSYELIFNDEKNTIRIESNIK